MKTTRLISKFLNRVKLFRKARHLYLIKRSHTVRKKLIAISQTEDGYKKMFSYLRKISPFVYEELILSCIEHSNHRVYRNLKYTGDGGVDGEFKIKKGNVLIQCKRYSKYVNNKDVSDFSNIVMGKHVLCGLFVHTGKTGKSSREAIKRRHNVIFLSGRSMLELILDKLDIESYINQKLKTQ